MDIAAYLKQSKITPSAFSRAIGVSPESVRRYLQDGRVPRADIMARIVETTQGQVLPNDFFKLNNGGA